MNKVMANFKKLIFKTLPVLILPLIIVLTFCLPLQAAGPESNPADYDTLQPPDTRDDSTPVASEDAWYPGEIKLDFQGLNRCLSQEPQPFSDFGASNTVLLTDGFEGAFPNANWTIYYDPAGPYWGNTLYKAHKGSKSVWCAGSSLNPANSNYPSTIDTFMSSGPFDLSDATSAELDFSRWIKTQLVTNGDLSTGDTFWVLASTTGPQDDFYGYYTSMQSATWKDDSFDLSDWPYWGDLCGEPSVYIAFAFLSNGDAKTDKGVFLDDVKLSKKSVLPPDPPSDLWGEAISSKQVNLYWSDNSSNESGFYIERRKESDASFKQIGKAAANITTYTDKGGTALTTYFYRIRSYNADGNSDYSNEIDVTTLTEPPSPPVLTAPKNGATGVGLTPTLSWNAPIKGEVDHYILQIALDSKFTDASIDLIETADTSYEFEEGDLNWNAKYYWRVRALNSEESSSAWSSSRNFKTAVGPPPDAPSDLWAEAISSKQVNLYWSDNSSNESGFYIERKKESDASFKQIGKVAANIATYIDKKGLTAVTTYYYRIRAYNATGNSDYCEEIDVTTPPPPPPKPKLLSPKNGATKIGSNPVLSWTGVAEYYGVQIATDSKFSEEGLVLEDEVYEETFYEVWETLEWNTKYYWRVNATSEESTSDWSSVFNFKTAAGPPPEAPSDLEAEAIASNKIMLYWSDNSDDETGFYIERKKSSESIFKQVAKVGADITEYLDSKGLTAGTTYDYRVKAYNSIGDSNYTETATSTTWPAPPNAPALVTPANSAKVSDLNPVLSWNAPTKGEAEYYDLQVALDSKFTDPFVDDSWITDTSYELWYLEPNTTHYWRVRAVDSYGGDFTLVVSQFQNAFRGMTLSTFQQINTALKGYVLSAC